MASDSKYVKVMCDYLSTGVWDKNDRSMSVDDLPITFWLKQMLKDWQVMYDTQDIVEQVINGEYTVVSHLDIVDFSKIGYAIAVKIKQQLPDYEVFYFDEHLAFHSNEESEYILEIK